MAELKENFNPAAFMIPAFLISKMVLTRFYTAWLSKCKSVYKQGGWVPVPRLTYVSNDAIPGTSWIPSVGISTEINSKSMPSAKKKWSLMEKLRNNSSNSSGSNEPPSPILGKSPHSSKLLAHSPKDDSSAASGTKSVEEEYEYLASPSGAGGAEPPKAHRHYRVPSTVNKSIPVFRMEVPTVVDTLTSAHLRRLFFATFLDFRLGDDEKALWNSLSKFQADFVAFTDAAVVEHQSSIREAAMKVLDDNPSIPNHDELVSVIKESKYNITSRFFFDAETKLYGAFHNSYQSFLVNNQWVRC